MGERSLGFAVDWFGPLAPRQRCSHQRQLSAALGRSRRLRSWQRNGVEFSQPFDIRELRESVGRGLKAEDARQSDAARMHACGGDIFSPLRFARSWRAR